MTQNNFLILLCVLVSLSDSSEYIDSGFYNTISIHFSKILEKMNQWWISVMIVVLLSAVSNADDKVLVRQSSTGCKNPNGTID